METTSLTDTDIQRIAAAMAPTVATLILEAMQPQIVKGDRAAAQELGVSASTLRRYRRDGILVEGQDYSRVGERAYQYNIARCRQRSAGR